jgi:SSS family solute:Na+ symporter
VFSAELSSADAILFMLSTSLSQDLYRRFVQPAATDRQVLVVSRWAAVAGGTLGVALAIVLPSVISSLTIFYTLLTVSLFVPVAAGLHSRRAGTMEALAAVAGGVGVVAVMRVGAMEHGVWTAGSVGLLASAAVFFTLYAARRIQGR